MIHVYRIPTESEKQARGFVLSDNVRFLVASFLTQYEAEEYVRTHPGTYIG